MPGINLTYRLAPLFFRPVHERNDAFWKELWDTIYEHPPLTGNYINSGAAGSTRIKYTLAWMCIAEAFEAGSVPDPALYDVPKEILFSSGRREYICG